MMQPFATTLAQAGFVAVTFDFPGHGRNPAPLAGGLSDDTAAAGVLLEALGRVVTAARPLGDGRRGAARPFHGGRHRHPLGLRPAGG